MRSLTLRQRRRVAGSARNKTLSAEDRLWVGMSGYSYKHWSKGVFYPESLPLKEWFEYYQTQFSTVELNVTFYRMPNIQVVSDWYKRSRPDFRFFVKGSRYITHIKRLKEPGDSLKYFFQRIAPLKEKMAGVLWQLPPKDKKDAPRLKAFLKTQKKFRVPRTVFEFRDETWFDDEIAALLEDYEAAYCRADRRDYYKRVAIPDTAPFVYIRRHGSERPGGEGDYSSEEIRRDVDEALSWLSKGKTVYVYYNNDGGGAAVRNGRDFIEKAMRVKNRLA